MSYIQTLSGKKFDYLNSTTDDVEIEDIATALSGNDSNLLIVFYVQIMPDDFVMQLHRF